MPRFGPARVASVGVAVVAAVALALGSAAAVRGGPDTQAAGPPNSPPPVPGGPVFAPKPTFLTTGPRANTIASADFNGDGSADLAVGSESNDDDDDDQAAEDTAITLLLSDGRGGFTRSRLPSGAASLAAADLDADGDADLVATDHFKDRVAVLLGDGRGHFADPARYDTTGGYPGPLLVVDLDRDRIPDLVVGNRNSGDIAVMLGDGRGGFAYPTRFRASFGDTIVAADLDADGAPELVLSGETTVAVAHNDGSGTFDRPKTQPPQLAERIVLSTADVDGDGVTDVVAAAEGIAVVLQPDGAGGLREGPRIRTAKYSSGPVTATDIDGDGRRDLVAVDGSAKRVTTALGLPGGGFAKPSRTPLVFGPGAASLVDVDGDCAPDLVVAGGRRVAIYLNTRQVSCVETAPAPKPGTVDRLGAAGRNPKPPAAPPGGPVFSDARRFGLAGRIGEVVVADFDRDGNPDIATSEIWENRVAVMRGDGRGGFGRPWRVSTDSGYRPPEPSRHRPVEGSRGMSAGPPLTSIAVYDERPSDLAAGDVDGDGDLDLVVAMFGAHDIAVLLGDGKGRFAEPLRYLLGKDIAPVWLALADLDGDGDLDVVTNDQQKPGLSVLSGDGKGGFEPAGRLRGTGDRLLGRMAVTDLDADGDPDVVVLARAGAQEDQGSALMYRNDGRGRFGGPASFPVGLRSKAYLPAGVAIGDLDGDGLVDLAVTHPYSDNVAVLRGDGHGGFGPPTVRTTGGFDASSVAIDDVTGDGAADLLVANRSSNEVAVLVGDGRGGLADPVRVPVGGRSPGSLVVADVNDDDGPDIVVGNDGSDDISVLRNKNRRATAGTAN